MAKRIQAGYWDMKKFASGLRSLTDGLPTESEKTKLRQHFDEVVSFLNETQKALEALPSAEDAIKAKKAIEAFEELAEKAKSSAPLSSALRMQIPRAPKAKTPTMSEEEQRQVQGILDDLRSMSIDDINKRLSDEQTISSRQLEALASLVGLRPNRRSGRDTVISQISTKISNFRGYQELKNGSSSE